MKIIHIAESFAGGVYDFLADLTNGLPEYEYLIIYGKRENTPLNFEKDFPQRTRFIYWQEATREINPAKDLKALLQLIKILKNENFDILHLHSSKAGFLGRLAARILGVQNKVIYTSHGVSFLRKDVSNFKLKQFIYFEKLAYKFGGKIIACSRSEAEEFKKYGIEAEYIYNGIKCNIDYSKSCKKYSKNLIIGTVGRLTYQKNPSLFNEIAKHFEDIKAIKFLWIGDGELRNELTSKNIEITGWLPKDEVFNKLQEIDIYLSTSLWEGLPLSVLQAMCMSKPLILSNCVGNKDLVKNGYNGFLFNDKQEAVEIIMEFLEDSKMLNIIGKNSLSLLKGKFSIDKMLEKYKKLYFNIHKNK